MRTPTRILLALAALLALPGIAAAQCLECDADGEPGDSGSYSSVDVGAVTDPATAGGDTDLSLADSDEGFWAWLSLCFSAFFGGIEEALGLDTGLDANVEGYASQHGADLDATVTLPGPACEAPDGALPCAVSFDESPAGDLDGKTWEAMGEVHEATGAEGVTLPVDGDAIDGTVVEGCVGSTLAGC